MNEEQVNGRRVNQGSVASKIERKEGRKEERKRGHLLNITSTWYKNAFVKKKKRKQPGAQSYKASNSNQTKNIFVYVRSKGSLVYLVCCTYNAVQSQRGETTTLPFQQRQRQYFSSGSGSGSSTTTTSTAPHPILCILHHSSLVGHTLSVFGY